MEATKRARARRAIVTGVAALTLAGLGLGAAVGTGQASAATGGSEEAATEYEWSIDLDCTICHQNEAEGLGVSSAGEEAAEADDAADAEASDKSEAADTAESAASSADAAGSEEAEASEEDPELRHFAAQHVADFGLTCVTCHEDSPELEKAHAKLNSGKTAKRLKKTKVSSEVCLTCHVQEDLAKATAGYEGIVDSKGTVVNPHDLPVNDDHASISCVSCHKAHDTEDSVQQNAMTTCTGCHHAGVFECGTCH